jgi:hypothetical protein
VWNMFAFARELIVAVVIFVGVPLLVGQVIVSWRIQLKKAGIGRDPVPAGDLSHQLETLQQSVDAMAIEVERISEAQRATVRPQIEAPLDGGLITKRMGTGS